MIGWIAGQVLHRGADHVVIDVGGVGYVVHVSDRTLAALPPPGGSVALFTELLVREDLLQLFGFSSAAEKEWHRLLVSVQGVGAKASMAILGALGVDGVARAIALGDAAAVRAAPGVGPKLAQRVVHELRDKVPALMALAQDAPAVAVNDAQAPAPVTPGATRPQAAPQPPPSASARADAMSALGNLGYGPSDAARAVAEAQQTDPDADTATLIRTALRLLAPKG